MHKPRVHVRSYVRTYVKVLRGVVIPTLAGAWQHVVLQTMCLDLVSGLISDLCLHASVRYSRGMIRWQSVGPLKNIEGRSQMVILCKNQMILLLFILTYMYLLFPRVDLNQSSRKQNSFDHRRRKSLG